MSTSQKQHISIGLILLSYAAFVALGMPDGILGIAWPSIRAKFAIPLDSLGQLLILGTAGYLTSSFLSGKIISRLGVGRVLILSCLLTGSALIGYTLVPYWWMMVILGFFSGLGAGAIDSGLNTYVAANFHEGLMQWLHASYGVGVTLGPMIMTYALTSLQNWTPGYRVVGGFQWFMAICFIFSFQLFSKTTNSGSDQDKQKITEFHTPMIKTLKQTNVWMSLLLFFFYVGAEVSLGSWTYTLLTESRGIPSTSAGVWAGSFWATFTIGRIIAGLFAKRVGTTWLITGSLSLALVSVLLLFWNPADWTNLLAIILVGLSIAPIFPALVSSTNLRVGNEHTANTIGMQMAIGGLGSSLIPALVGVIAKKTTLEIIPVCLIVLFAGLILLFRIASGKNKSENGNDVG